MNSKRKKRLKIYATVICFFLVLSLSFFGILYTRFKAEAKVEAIKYGMDYRLVLAIMKVESNFKTDAVSSKGAVGLMQIMPDTAKWICEKQQGIGVYNYDLLSVAEFNIKLGVWYLDYLLNKFDLPFALAAYNAGEGVVKEWLNKGIVDVNEIPYSETRIYIKRVLFYYKLYFFK